MVATVRILKPLPKDLTAFLNFIPPLSANVSISDTPPPSKTMTYFMDSPYLISNDD